VRIGLLELVGRAVRQELEHLVGGRLALDEAGDRRRLVGVLELAQGDIHLLGRRRRADRTDGVAQGGLEPCFERAAQREQRRLPLPALVDAGEPAVVQLVAAVERELEVLVGEGIRAVGQRDRRQAVRRRDQLRKQCGARGAPWFVRRHSPLTVPGSAAS
jgi:hypothetical protein